MKISICIVFIILLVSSTLISQDEFEIQSFLSGVKVEDICNDKENIWVATNGNGVYQYSIKNNKWKNFSTQKGSLPNDFIYCVAANDQFVWAGSIDGLLVYEKRSNRWTKRKFGKGGQLSNWIRSIAFDSGSDLVWIGRFQYLTKYDVKRRRFTDYDLTEKGNEKTNTIKEIQVDGDSLVWFGTEAGLHKYDKFRDLNEPGAVTFYDNRLNFFNGEGEDVSINTILFEQGNVWIGLDEFITPQNPDFNLGGLYKFDRENVWTKFGDQRGFPANGIYDIERAGNFLWVSLYQFGKNTKEQYGRGLALINILTEEVQIIFDDRIPQSIPILFFDGEYMWLGSDSGIFRINLNNQLAKWGRR